jgi:hypothetical protein
VSIQSWKWGNIDSIFQFIIFSGNYSLRSSQNALQQWVNCQDWTRFPDPLWRHPSYGQVSSLSNPDLWRRRPNVFRTFKKEHRTWQSRMLQLHVFTVIQRIRSLAHCSEMNTMKKTRQILRMMSSVCETDLINLCSSIMQILMAYIRKYLCKIFQNLTFLSFVML